ncbi:MAG: ATP-binding protein [Candidatus Woesearchaeota archaeon]
MDHIEALINKAKQLEGVDNSKAAKAYLIAAQQMIKDRHSDVSRAKALFEKGKALKGLPVKQDDAFSHIGGLEHVKEEIRLRIVEPFLNPELFRMYGKQPGGGILLYGPPGCGKTLIARAIADQIDAEFKAVQSADIESKWIGETQQNLRNLFEEARSKRMILFFDEFDILGRDRSETTHEHSKDKVSALLSEIDGINENRLLLLAATNEPWAIDPALRREGRFGRTLFVPLPDYKARITIMKNLMKDRPIGSLNFESLARKTMGFSGADITAVCEIATDSALNRAIATKKKEYINMTDFTQALDRHNSIVHEWFRKARQQIEKRGMMDSFKELHDAGQELEKIEMIRKGNLDYFLTNE